MRKSDTSDTAQTCTENGKTGGGGDGSMCGRQFPYADHISRYTKIDDVVMLSDGVWRAPDKLYRAQSGQRHAHDVASCF